VNRIITLLNTGRAAGAFMLVFGLVSTGAPAAPPMLLMKKDSKP
jgi:hypothetical protein